ncbi:1-(5-phosphoribosyl)-5-[(5-phosphoribosylamino)methylideneamino]imidazole-4-carboxamide isomerase [candidate division NPL-UPA2 bacterium]|nr:1-(5-phosphoribosyl)-5-[(5-phosphoribosylamino)methylideneamino]imidazole-4-carboxamide isomerase [candidate division NPL-UPA2 bacterium]
MLIIPAIDIRDGRVVRLVQGNFAQETVYDDDPVRIARKWGREGAKLLHIVDLDGAREGRLKNLGLVENIAKEISIPVELGGGIRNLRTVEEVLNKGIERVIMGTKAIESPELIKEACREFGERIVIGIDVRDGLVAIRGWASSTSRKAVTLAEEMESLGARTIIFTDIRSDGMLSGPHLESLKEMLKAITIPLIASGGVSSLEDIKSLKSLESEGLQGVIVGKALYAGCINLREAITIVEAT